MYKHKTFTMDQFSGEKYLISRAKSATDANVAKAMILTAKTIFPKDFRIQFEAYLFEKASGNHDEAAKSFSYLLMTFQNQQPPELWKEVANLTAALRAPEDKANENNEESFYIKMFQHISFEVQHNILLLTASNSDNQIENCRLILLLLKRFPQTISTHAPRLLETLIQGMTTNLVQCREILVQEALPLIMSKPIDLPTPLIDRILFVNFEYYMNRMFVNPNEKHTAWSKIFEVMEVYSKQLKWEPFPGYNKSSKDIYWQRLIQIVSSSPPKPSENKQIVYYATLLFMMSLQEYVENVKKKVGDNESEFLLVEGIREGNGNEKRRKLDIDPPPQISVTLESSPEVPICLVTAAHCWQLLHSNEILQLDFTQLIINISTPLTKWINRFLLDLAVYLGRNDEALSLMKQDTAHMSALEKSVRLLSLTLNSGALNLQSFEHIQSILQEMPATQGNYLPSNTLVHTKRQLLLLPLTRKAVLQYCVKAIIVNLKTKLLTEPNCTNLLIGNLLVLTQLDWPTDIEIANSIFERINQKRTFTYLLFPNYIVNIDMIEEFMHLWSSCEVKLEFVLSSQSSSRRIGTRGSDKGVKEDFKQIIKQQVSRSNEDIDSIIVQFLQQEHMMLVQNVFEK